MPVELHPHQQKAVDELGNGKILRGDPGVGKSFTALAYFFTKECCGVLNDWGSMRTPKDLYIITTAKKRGHGDWQHDAYKLGLMEDPEISVEGIRVTVDSWNNIEKYEGVKDAFFIFDEQRVVGSGQWSKSFIKLAKANRWILLSATPGDTWLDYVPVFLANGFYKNRTEFVREHVVYASWVKFPKVDHYRQLGRLVRNRNAVLVEMPFESHTTRNIHWTEVWHDVDELERVTKRRWHVFEKRPLRDVAELFSVARKVVNSSPSRLETIRQLQQKHKRIVVFYNFDYELELLRTLGGPDTSQHTHSSMTTTPSDWEYLLSPDGMKANSSASTSSSTSTQLESTTRNSRKTSKPSSTMSSVKNSGSSPISELGSKLFSRGTVLSIGGDGKVCTGYVPPPTALTSPYEIPKPPLKALVSTDKVLSTNGIPKPSSDSTPRRSTTPHLSSVKDSSGDGSIVVAEWNGHKHQAVPTTKEWIYLVQYRAGSEAWNCTTADTVVFYSQTYSYKDFEQSQGRIDRINTPFKDLYYYVLYSNSWIDLAIKKALDLKQDFNEARLRHRIEAQPDIERIVELAAAA